VGASVAGKLSIVYTIALPLLFIFGWLRTELSSQDKDEMDLSESHKKLP